MKVTRPSGSLRPGRVALHLSVTRNGCGVLRAALGGNALEVAALTEGGHGIGGQALGDGPVANDWADVGAERVLETGFGIHEFATGLRRGEFGVIDERGLGV